jgi:hypothetical protein
LLDRFVVVVSRTPEKVETRIRANAAAAAAVAASAVDFFVFMAEDREAGDLNHHF